jgi:acetoin utilization protein AcuB
MHPTIEQFMTTAPWTIGSDQTVETARRMMAELGVRHLPVRSEGELVGIVDRGDLGGFTAVDPVALAMSRAPLVVAPEALLTEVAATMAERRRDAAIVVDGGRVVGIFTAADATRLLATVVDTLERTV